MTGSTKRTVPKRATTSKAGSGRKTRWVLAAVGAIIAVAVLFFISLARTGQRAIQLHKGEATRHKAMTLASPALGGPLLISPSPEPTAKRCPWGTTAAKPYCCTFKRGSCASPVGIK